MKLSTLFTSTIFTLAAASSFPSPETLATSDIWIGLNLNKCLVNAEVIPQANLAAQKVVAKEVIAAYNAWDIERILGYRTPDCKQNILPASLNRTAMTNDEYRVFFKRIEPLYKNFTARVLQETHDPEAHTCIIHARSTATTAIGPYGNEYALILTFTEDGTKVKYFDEFVDSAYTLDYGKRLTAALANGTGTGL
ncbi:hypothetical protein J4E83_000692 [Alternaria metachromatica]|uniref:uncharacterized protein n=1 Tax=Alternaria metachromatica TaxID=283354 RepID=UPI0020C3EA39|nr:uncharacterized protein J4E83_000692 [Alternaria metachromatica]KAI4637874.1 hypothetical protein J4E83_000692 [Alternaria metachromatica]